MIDLLFTLIQYLNVYNVLFVCFVFQTEVKKKSLLFEPTQAYVGDDNEDSNQGREEKRTSMLNEPTQAFVGGDDEDSNQGTEEKGTALMNEPTQAFPGKVRY